MYGGSFSAIVRSSAGVSGTFARKIVQPSPAGAFPFDDNNFASLDKGAMGTLLTAHAPAGAADGYRGRRPRP